MRYCIWNNKGGVGKSFLTYSLAVEYAKKHPEKRVAVIDLCPQANVSSMILGGNGDGEANLIKLSQMDKNGKTIAGYIKDRRRDSIFQKNGRELGYFVRAIDYNDRMPSNLFLLAGDMELDICSIIIDYLANAPERNSWINSRLFVKDLADSFENAEGNNEDSTTFFIDTNPSFANYTQLGIIASDRLLIPCTADSFSIRAIHNLFRLVYGVKTSADIKFDDDLFATFSNRVAETSYLLPKIHAIILNKSRRFDKKASKAWQAHADEIKKLVSNLLLSNSSLFTNAIPVDKMVFDVKDSNTISTVLNNKGIAPSSLRQTLRGYEVYGETVMVNQTQIDPYIKQIHEIVTLL